MVSSESGYAEVPENRSPALLYFVQWPLKFVGLQDGTYFMPFSRRLNCLSNLQIYGNLCGRLVQVNSLSLRFVFGLTNA